MSEQERTPSPVVLIAVPCQDQCASLFAYDLAGLVGYTIATRPDIVVHRMMNKGTLIANQRHSLAAAVVENPAITHVLWLDSDMRFPKDALLRLLAHEQPIVAADYARRRKPIWGVAFKDGGNVVIGPEAEGLIAVDAVGMGCMLVERRVFEAIDRPWFAIGYNAGNGGSYVGEDIYFCRKATDAGFPVLIDPKLTRETGHLGEFEYTREHVLATHAAYRAAAEAAAP